MTTVSELVSGDLVRNGGASAVYVEQAPHPLYPGLRLVIWRLVGGLGDWSHDALSPQQDIGEVVSADHAERQRRLQGALLGPRMPW